MAQCVINGIPILFPYEPYKVQEAYMTKVIECLKNGVNGILESPTGTGKTLSLLCSSLAWLETRKAQQQLAVIQHSGGENLLNDLKSSLDVLSGVWDKGTNFMLPKIIYSSRTHSQLSQATQELKRSNYNHVKSVILGSRDQLCLHAEVSKVQNHSAKVFMCRAKISSKSCPFFLNFEEKIISTPAYQDTPIVDIEDLIVLGKKHKVCPYYAAKNLKTKADIIFTPYNYLISPKSRQTYGIELQGNVLIFDEAHNIESACEESMSFQLRSYDVALCITEITQTMEMVKDFDSTDFDSSDNGAPDFTLADLSILKVMFCELEEMLDKAVAECSAVNGIKSGDYMIEVLSKIEVNTKRKDLVLELLDKIVLFHSASRNLLHGVKGAGLLKFSDILKILYSKTSEGYTESSLQSELANKYKVLLQYESQNKSKDSADPWAAASKKKQSWKLECWCFSPAVGMQGIASNGVHSLILTSGTLSPLGPMIAELGLDFPVQLENSHIIKDSQVFVAVVPSGPDGTALNSSYQNRFNQAYISSLGRTICNFSRIIPDGLLVFFPSYSVLKSNQEAWEENGIWRSLCGAKPLFLEPQGKDAFQESIEKYYSTIKDPELKGATLMAVCRGKVSEGLDFADKNARGVIITGLPFPPSMDPRVKMKMEYLNNLAKNNKGLLGNDWYVLQASRAVNQAIGRVIRHKYDYGAILLCDDRFKQKRIQQHLSKWIHGRIITFESFGPALRQLSSFFKAIDPESLRPKTNSCQIGSFQSGGTIIHSGKSAPATSQRGKTIELAAENIFEGYMPENKVMPSSDKSADSSSVFDEFEKMDTKPIRPSPLTTSSFSSTNWNNDPEVLPSPDKPKEAKKRKINIKLRQANQPEPEKSTEEIWKTFLLDVKKILSVQGRYIKFCDAIKEYRSTKDVCKFASALSAVFKDIPGKQNYIKTASHLVDLENRAKFLELCL